MRKREQYAEAQRLQEEIDHELKTRSLTPEQRKELETYAAGLAGVLLHPWLPMSWVRRLVMAAIVLFGVQQAWVGNYQAMFLWLLLPTFSPRIMGECAFFMGRLARLLGYKVRN